MQMKPLETVSRLNHLKQKFSWKRARENSFSNLISSSFYFKVSLIMYHYKGLLVSFVLKNIYIYIFMGIHVSLEFHFISLLGSLICMYVDSSFFSIPQLSAPLGLYGDLSQSVIQVSMWYVMNRSMALVQWLVKHFQI